MSYKYRLDAPGLENALLRANTGYRPLVAVGVCALVLVALLLVVMSSDPWVMLTVTALALLWIVPLGLEFVRGRIDIFAPIHLIGGIYFLYFGFGTLWVRAHPESLYDTATIRYVPLSALYCLIGYALLLVGYYLPWKGRPRVFSSPFEEEPRGPWFLAVAGLVGTVGFVAESTIPYLTKMGYKVGGFVSLLGQFAPLFLFAWALAWLQLLSGRSTRATKITLLLVLLPAATRIAIATTGDKSLLITLVGVPIVAYWYTKRKIAWRVILAVVLLTVLVLFPFYNTFRVFDVDLSLKTRMSMTLDLVTSWDAERYEQSSIRSFLDRISMIKSTTVVVSDTGRWVPFARGRTIALLPVSLMIPRFLWPEKPTITLGAEFADTFRIRHPLDQTTNIGATVPGELYWNFHLPGIIVGMVVWGFSLRWLYRRYGESQNLNPVLRSIHIVLLIRFAHFGGNIAADAGLVIRFLLIVAAFRIACRYLGVLRKVPTVR